MECLVKESSSSVLYSALFCTLSNSSSVKQLGWQGFWPAPAIKLLSVVQGGTSIFAFATSLGSTVVPCTLADRSCNSRLIAEVSSLAPLSDYSFRPVLRSWHSSWWSGYAD